MAVVVDVPLATGHRLDAAADYAAFVALGHIRVGSRPGGVPSILDLFDPEGGGSDTLTRWDVAYLSALYQVTAGRTAEAQRERIAGDMTGIIAR